MLPPYEQQRGDAYSGSLACLARLLVLLAAVICFAAATQAQTIDFSLSSFTSGYSQVAANGTVFTSPGDYGLTTNPSTGFTNGYGSYLAPTGSGDMLLADGYYPGTNVWLETVSGLTVGTTYTFVVDVADPDPAGSSGEGGCCNPALLGFFVNGTEEGSTFDVGETPATWMEWTTTFTATSTSVDLSIQDLNEVPYVAGDDFTLAPVPAIGVTPEPASTLLFGTGLLAIAFIMRKRLFA